MSMFTTRGKYILCGFRKSNLIFIKFQVHQTSVRLAVTANDFLEHFKRLKCTTLPEDPHAELDEESIYRNPIRGNSKYSEKLKSLAVKT